MLHLIDFISILYDRYRNVFEQYSEIVRTHCPHISVVGEPYPPSKFKVSLSRILTILKYTLIVIICLDLNPFSFLNISTPLFYSWAIKNKIHACMMLFFLPNLLQSYLMTTGAFEISVDDALIWSKLQTGRLPSNDEFIEILQQYKNPKEE